MTDADDERSRSAGPHDPARDPSERTRPGGAPRPPRPLTPSRPWQADDPVASDAPRADRDPDPVGTRSRPAPPSGRPGPVPAAERDTTGLAPNRPWRRESEPAADGDRAPTAEADREVSRTGLAPIRPWNHERPSPAVDPRTPQPSNPDVVAERAAETDDERRRRFARQHAAADAARLADPPSLSDNAPLPPSHEPHPAGYDVTTDGDGEPRRRRFGRRRRDELTGPELQDAAPEPDPAPSQPAPPAAPRYSGPPPVARPEAPPVAAPYVRPPVDWAAVPSPAPASLEPAPTPDEPDPMPPMPADRPSAPSTKGATTEPPREEPVAPEGRRSRRRLGRGRRQVEEATPIVPPVVEAAPDGPVEPGPVGKATRWLLERTPEPAADPTPETVDVTDAPALDLELADEFHGELEAPVSGASSAEPPATLEPTAGGSGAALPPAAFVTPVPRVRRGWRRRQAPKADDDEGPFFPPEPADLAAPTPAEEPSVPPAEPAPALVLPSVASVLDDVPLPAASEVPAVPVSRNRPRPRPAAAIDPPTPPSSDTPPPTPEQLSPARQRPRPRPAAARAAASPAAETPTEPDPAGPADLPTTAPGHPPETEPEPAEPESATTTEPNDPSGRRGAAGSTSDDAESTSDKAESTSDKAEPKTRKLMRRRRIRGTRWLRVLTKLLIVAVVAVVAAVVLRTYVVAPYYIPSASMEPALQGGGGTNDRILVDKITYRVHDPHQGDIVVFDRPDTWRVPDKTLVKRIIGLPGDIVSLRRGLVYVNGTRLTENYVNKACGAAATKPLTGTSQWTVPMGDYFVMGDNRCDSEDSRAFGPIPDSKIVGRAFLIVWPLNRFGTP